jgi:4-hydroxyproline epimerase
VKRVRVIDSHTEGETTRVVIEGMPDLASSTLPGKVDELRRLHDGLRSGIVREPRGHEAIVGAYLIGDRDVIFFNNTQYLGMCGHGTIGVVATLAYLNRLTPGKICLGTPVGDVRAKLHEDGRVTVWNVPSFRQLKGVSVEAPGFGEVMGDVAYGGNWFFLSSSPIELCPSKIGELTAYATAIKLALARQETTGRDGAEIDHVELFGPPIREDADSKNFVLCPGLAYDRSPCGTGLSAKLACLAADGKLQPGQTWRQESIIGSLFEGSYDLCVEGILPAITGRAWITGETELIFEDDDPFREGIVL